MTKQRYFVMRIKNWMEIRGKTPADMAHLMGVSVPTWYRKMQYPGKMTVQELELLERVTNIEIFKSE